MTILFTGILLIIYSVLARNVKRYNLAIGFMFAFIIMAFQSNVEGDFMSYMQDFGSGKSRTMDDEPLWIFLQMPFYSLGWQSFVFFLAGFQVWAVYKLTKIYAPFRYQYLGAILFFFTFGMMLIQMKALRQGLATEISLLPFLLYIENKRTLFQRAIVCFGPATAAFLVHNSAIVTFLPATILFLMYQKGWMISAGKKRRNEWSLSLVISIAFLTLFFLKKTVFSNFFVAMSEILKANEMRLGGYLVKDQNEDMLNISWLIVMYDAVMAFLCSWFFEKTTGKWRILAMMAIISYFADMLLFGMGALPRIGYYFTIVNTAVIPCIVRAIHDRYGKTFAILFTIFCIGYAVKTSLPWLTTTTDGRFGTYEFSFFDNN